MMKIPTYIRVAALVATVAVAGACGGGAKKNAQVKPAAAVATTLASTTSTTTVESKILADLAAYNTMYRRILEKPDPVDPELPARLTVGNLDLVRTYLAQLKQSHQFVKGPATDTYHLVSVGGTIAVVDECTRDDSHFYGPDGQVPDTPADHVTGHEVRLVLEGGTWKVADVAKKATAC